MTEEVFVRSNSRRSLETYHTDESCRALQRANNYRAVDRDVLFDDLEECSYCAGTIEIRTGEKLAALADKQCRTCGADLEPDGTCGFCQRFEEVMA